MTEENTSLEWREDALKAKRKGDPGDGHRAATAAGINHEPEVGRRSVSNGQLDLRLEPALQTGLAQRAVSIVRTLA